MLKKEMIFKKKLFFYFLGSLSLIVGFIFKENSAGGGEHDFLIVYQFIEAFSKDLGSGFKRYFSNTAILVHPPSFYLLAGLLTKIFGNFFVFQILYLILCLCLPYIFYKILKEKFSSNTNYLFYISLIIFLSPYFRTSAVWTLGDNLSLIFFGLFVFYLVRGEKRDSSSDFLFSLIFLVLCSYTRYYYAIFWIYFIYVYYQKFKFKNLLNFLLLSIFFAIPVFIYFFYIINYHNYFDLLKSYTTLNIFFPIIQILSILSFYFIPFIYFSFNEIKIFFKNRKKIMSIFFISTFFILIFEYFNFLPILGGGVFFKLYKFLEINVIIYISIFISIFSIIFFSDYEKGEIKLKNYILLICLFASFPFSFIYQKYLDPLFFLLFFGLLESKQINKLIIHKNISLPLTYIYFAIFLLFALYYYLI